MRFVSTLAVCACVALVTSTGSAQSDAVKDEAMKRYQEGVVLYDKGQQEAAYARFAEAYAVVQTPSILFNLARTEQLTGRLVDAARHFREYLALPAHPKITPELRQQATTFQSQLRTQLGHIAVEAPLGTILSVDDKAVSADGPIDVVAGVHTVVGKLRAETRSVTITCTAGSTSSVRLAFDDSTAAPFVAPVAPVPSDTAPRVQIPELPPGGARDEQGGDVRTGIWIGLGATAVVAAGVGIGFIVGAGSEGNTVQQIESHQKDPANACNNPNAPMCAQRLSAADAQSRDDGVATGLFVGGAVLLAGAIGVLVWQRTSPKKSGQAWIVPSVSPTGGGALWVGSF
jgi:hypothetical protein